MKGQKKLTRREMLKLSGTVVAGSVLAAACAPAVAPTLVPPTPVAPTAVPPTVAPTKVPPTSAPAPAAAAGPVTLELYNPSGATEVTQLFAARLDDLAGKVICELSNDKWQAERTLPLVQELLQRMYPTATIIPYTEFPIASDITDISKVLKQKGCQAVILGNAG